MEMALWKFLLIGVMIAYSGFMWGRVYEMRNGRYKKLWEAQIAAAKAVLKEFEKNPNAKATFVGVPLVYKKRPDGSMLSPFFQPPPNP